jgi:hypothetical protein
MMAFTKSVAALGAVLALSTGGNGASAQDAPPVPAISAEWLESQTNERGQKCDKRAENLDQTRALLACGAAGAWEITLSEAGPRFVRSHEFDGEVIGFLTDADGRVWVKLLVLQARPLSSAAAPATVTFPAEQARPLPAPTRAPPSPSPPAAVAEAADREAAQRETVGEVLESTPGELIISLGSTDGVTPSDRIELALEPDDDSGPAMLSRETLAVGVVTNVSPHTAKVRLGLNERVPVGALASVTRAPLTASSIAPPRVTGVWAAEAMARPFAAMGELGGGLLLSASLTRRFLGHLALRASLDPLALADVQGQDSLNAVNAALIASYDSSFFEMGLGLGAQTVNETDFFVDTGSGWTLAQLVRFGAQDGLNLSARTSIVLFRSEFEFGGMVGSLQIPVGRNYWLLFGGGGGNVGYGYGEFGVRALLDGNGHAGSKFLTIMAGGAAVFTSATCAEFADLDQFPICRDQRSYGGPMAGIGSEWRF